MDTATSAGVRPTVDPAVIVWLPNRSQGSAGVRSPGIWHKSGWHRVGAKTACVRALLRGRLQLLLPAIAAVDPVVVHHDHHDWQVVPAGREQSFWNVG